MLYNIFKKSSKIKQKIKPLIIADVHEKNSLVISELCKSADIQLQVRSLEIGDYIINNIAVERKTVSDLISSMINKRLIQQLKQMQNYTKSLLIIEGDLKDVLKENNNISKAIRGLIVSISLNYKTPIIESENCESTAQYLITLAKQQEKPKTEISLHSRIPKTKAEQKSYILESFPNIGPIKSKELLEKFRTIKNIINASEEELEKILRKNVKKFKELIES